MPSVAVLSVLSDVSIQLSLIRALAITHSLILVVAHCNTPPVHAAAGPARPWVA